MEYTDLNEDLATPLDVTKINLIEKSLKISTAELQQLTNLKQINFSENINLN